MASANELKAMSLIKEIQQCHIMTFTKVDESIDWAIRCGELLTISKSYRAHGQFGGFIEQYFDFSLRTAQRYMKLHNDLHDMPKATRLALLKSAASVNSLQNLLPAPEKPDPDPEVEEVLEIGSDRFTTEEGRRSDLGGIDARDYWPEPEAEPVAVATHSGNGKHTGNGRPTPSSKPITALTGRARDVWEAQQTIKTWVDAVGRWMNGNPAGIDVYREKFPGPLGDKVIDAAKALLNSLDAWKKVLK